MKPGRQILAPALWGLTLFLAGCGTSARRPDPPPQKAAEAPAPKADGGVVLASPGRIEGRSETVDVGASIDGVIKSIFVEEGMLVRPGHWLLRIDCPELPAQLAEARAAVESFKQAKVRIVRGTRDEERLAAEQRTAKAKAVLEQATTELRRVKTLVKDGVMARAVLDTAQRDYDVAVAQVQEAVRNEELAKARALPEDVAKSSAEIEAAERRVAAIEEKMTRCVVKSPCAGTVLRILMHPGESFSTVTPKPILQIADISVKRVRAEIDERDVAKVQLGQRVKVSLDSHPGREYTGTVTSLGYTMGRKKIRTTDPADKTDRDVLEALVDLDGETKDIPVGLRVVVRFLPPGA